ncbi:MAG: molybdenum cofactor cytidylyltransferase [SAR324 cluster bacterium]|nr:molybdenum cofactor cytidylyltransferase [SAR324 cluster bacterium]
MISAIVLAAGESKRMGAENKLLLPFRDKTLIESIVDNVLASEVHEVILVLGHEADRIRKALQNRHIRFVNNTDFRNGMTTSIQAGINAISSLSDGIMICLSDLPFIQSEEMNELIHSFENAIQRNKKQIVLPTFQGQRGNPVIFSMLYKAEILEHQGANGCKGVIRQNQSQVLEIEMSTANVLKDIDTKDDYAALVRN